VITNSHITQDPLPPAPGKSPATGFGLGRPWRAYSRVIVMNTELPESLNPAGWSVWGRNDPAPLAYYAQYNNNGPGWRPTEVAPWSHILTAKEAAMFEPKVFLAGTDHWNPIAEAAKLP